MDAPACPYCGSLLDAINVFWGEAQSVYFWFAPGYWRRILYEAFEQTNAPVHRVDCSNCGHTLEFPELYRRRGAEITITGALVPTYYLYLSREAYMESLL